MEGVIDGLRVKRVKTEPRCKCCQSNIRDTVERWLLLRRLRGHEADGSKVTSTWMVEQSEKRLGVRIGLSSWDSHLANHIEIIRDTTADEIVRTVDEKVDDAMSQLEHVSHTELLEMVVKAGAARVKADPSSISPELAVQAAKVLASLKQDEDRAQLLRMIAGGIGRAQIGAPVVVRELEPVIDVEEIPA